MSPPVGSRERVPVRLLCDKQSIDLVVVGPELPLAEEIADALSTEDRFVFGPRRDGGRIESDKAFAKDIAAAVPADARTFKDANSAATTCCGVSTATWKRPISPAMPPNSAPSASNDDRGMIPFPELTDETRQLLRPPRSLRGQGHRSRGRQGSDRAQEHAGALDAVERIMVDREFGEPEANCSWRSSSKARSSVCWPSWTDARSGFSICQDHKQVGEGYQRQHRRDGRYCPTPLVSTNSSTPSNRTSCFRPSTPCVAKVSTTAAPLRRTDAHTGRSQGARVQLPLRRPRIPTPDDAAPRRPGRDPLGLLHRRAARRGTRIQRPFGLLRRDVLEGYPGSYETGREITEIGEAADGQDVMVFHAGTMQDGEGTPRTSGGQYSRSPHWAPISRGRGRANAACDSIAFDGAFWRKDIGHRVMSSSSTQAEPARSTGWNGRRTHRGEHHHQ